MKQISYSYHYAQYDLDYENNSYHYEMVIREIEEHLQKEDQILDVGCTNGKLVYSLNKLDYKNVLGIDLNMSHDLVKIGIKKGLNLKVVKSLNLFLNNNKNKFKVIFLIDVLEHIPINGQIELLELIRESLKQNGILIIQVPNANSIISSRMRYIDWTHKLSFTEDSLSFLLKQSKFQETIFKEIRNFHKEPNFFKKIIVNFTKSILRKFYKVLLYSELDRKSIKKINLSPNLFSISKK